MIAVVTAAAFGLGYALQATLVNRAIASTNPLAAVLLTFGLSVILRNSMASCSEPIRAPSTAAA